MNLFRSVRRELYCLLLFVTCSSAMGAPTPAPWKKPGWKSVMLLSNDVVSAHLHFKMSSSLADRQWLILELENPNQTPLPVLQIYVGLDSEVVKRVSQMPAFSGNLNTGILGQTNLAQGRHVFTNVFDNVSGAIGWPIEEGLRMNASAYTSIQLRDGRSFTRQRAEVTFSLERLRPNPEELIELQNELKRLLAEFAIFSPPQTRKIPQRPMSSVRQTPDERIPRSLTEWRYCTSRIQTLMQADPVKDFLALQDLLPALKNSGADSIRHVVIREIFRKHADDPLVLAYYREAFEKHPDHVYHDAIHPEVWNSEFLEPLVRGCEAGRYHYFSVLERHAKEWKTDPKIVVRISTALMNRPILRQELGQIEDSYQLREWSIAVRDIGAAGDPKQIGKLTPALDDRRMIRSHPEAAVREPEFRVCDHAMFAILQILDGDRWTAFKKADLPPPYGLNDAQGSCDQLLPILKERLKSLAP